MDDFEHPKVRALRKGTLKKITSVRVRFVDIGRGKLSWEADLPNAAERTLIAAIREKNALASRDVEIMDGTVYVGGCRAVGRVEVVRG